MISIRNSMQPDHSKSYGAINEYES